MKNYIQNAALTPILHIPSPSPSLIRLQMGWHRSKDGALKGQPSIVLLGVSKGGNEVPLYPLEVETVFSMPVGEGQSVFGLYTDEVTRGLVDNELAQMYGYMLDNGFRFGVLTNGEDYCFLKCGEDGDLLIAEVRTNHRASRFVLSRFVFAKCLFEGAIFVCLVTLFSLLCRGAPSTHGLKHIRFLMLMSSN